MVRHKFKLLAQWKIICSPQRDVRALLIFPKGNETKNAIKTVGDANQIAQALGKRVFRTKEDIHVFPYVIPFPFIKDSYIVVVEKGSYKQPVVGR